MPLPTGCRLGHPAAPPKAGSSRTGSIAAMGVSPLAPYCRYWSICSGLGHHAVPRGVMGEAGSPGGRRVAAGPEGGRLRRPSSAGQPARGVKVVSQRSEHAAQISALAWHAGRANRRSGLASELAGLSKERAEGLSKLARVVVVGPCAYRACGDLRPGVRRAAGAPARRRRAFACLPAPSPGRRWAAKVCIVGQISLVVPISASKKVSGAAMRCWRAGWRRSRLRRRERNSRSCAAGGAAAMACWTSVVTAPRAAGSSNGRTRAGSCKTAQRTRSGWRIVRHRAKRSALLP